jgi:protein phosphatase 2C family protein 2/3
VKAAGAVRAYAANTNQGLYRNYNEDRVSIILNIVKPPSRSAETWPKCSFFGVYDGHGGSACADYLRDNLHQFVIAEAAFPSNPREALKQGFVNAERQFLEAVSSRSRSNTASERSGSCAIVALLVGDTCYVANVGDSRAVLSGDGGRKVFALSTDHKPAEEGERKRIVDAGGKIYQTQLLRSQEGTSPETILGPHRVLPGRLSVPSKQVSRTLGDAEAKMTRFGGNPGVIIALPDIRSFRVTSEHDFLILACDGIFDKLSNRETVQIAWTGLRESSADIHTASGHAVEAVMQLSLQRKSLDNVTVVLVALPGLRLTEAVSRD